MSLSQFVSVIFVWRKCITDYFALVIFFFLKNVLSEENFLGFLFSWFSCCCSHSWVIFDQFENSWFSSLKMSFLYLSTSSITIKSVVSECFSAGSQHGRSHPWQGHVERPDGQDESGLKGSSTWASYPQTKICLFTVCYTILFWQYRGLSPTTFLWEKLT